MQGLVQHYNVIRGFGFILRDFRTRVFFHFSNWKSDVAPRKGMLVEFETAPSAKAGMADQAVNIVPVQPTKNNGGAL